MHSRNSHLGSSLDTYSGLHADIYICFYVFGFSNINFYSSDVHSLSPDFRGLFLKKQNIILITSV